MAISRDDLHLCISKSIQFSTNSAWTFIKHHPFISFTLLFFSFLYVFFPWFFWALIHFLAFLILLTSITMLYFNFNYNYNYNPPEFEKSPVNDKNNNADLIKNRNGRPFVRARSVRQRKSRDTSRTSSVQSSEDEKKAVMVDKNPCLEPQENPKEIREVPEEIHGNIETESSEEEDETKNKAVQWTEDDEKNLMDLGFSEMERNKRLESLIARRRARKMFSLQIRKTLNKDISLIIPPPPPPIAILKNKPFSSQLNTNGGSGSGSGQVSPTPGSAPPVLLPAHDPFDLPYDPFEEKPVLTGGSFHQEFIAPEPHDAVFCRHESFCSGNTGEFKQDKNAGGHRNSEVLENCNQSEEKEDTDKIIQVESSCQSPESNFQKIEEIQSSEKGTVMVDDDIPEENQDTEVETKSMVVENPNYRSSSTSSEEDEPPFLRVDKEAILKSLTSPHPRSFSLDKDHTILNNYDAAMMGKAIYHRPTYSIASDMQVEVSEVGSPPQTIDGSFSSFDIGSPIEEEEDINYGNESLWELSSQISVNDEDNKSALKEIYRLHDEYTIKHGTSRCKQSRDSVELRDLVKDMDEQDVSGSFTRPDDFLNGSQEHIEDIHMEIKDNSQISTPESSQPYIPGILDFSDVENAENLTETGKESITEYNSFPSSTEPNVTEYEIRRKETMEVPQNTSTSISHFDTITDLQKPMEESNPSVSDEINNKSEDLANISEQVDRSDRLLVDTEETSHPSTLSMEADFFPTRTGFKVDEHEGRQNEPMEVTQSTSTRITNLETMASPQKPFTEHDSSSLDETNNKSEDPHEHLAPLALANPNEEVDTQSEPSVAIDERQNVTMEDPKNASSSSTSPLTKENLQETISESNPTTLDNKDDKQESPHKHEVNQENASLVKTEVSEPEVDASAASSNDKVTNSSMEGEGESQALDDEELPKNSEGIGL